jgi:hypothetical protein
MTLADEFEQQKRRDQILAWDSAERKLAESLPALPAKELSEDVRARMDVFLDWCGGKGVRYLPAKPATCAAFIQHQIAAGLDVQGCVALLTAIEQRHHHFGFPNPVRCPAVQAVLDQIVKSAPRAWTSEERADFALLPPEIRLIIEHREAERDRQLRRMQNEHAAKMKALEQSKEKGNENEGIRTKENAGTGEEHLPQGRGSAGEAPTPNEDTGRGARVQRASQQGQEAEA